MSLKKFKTIDILFFSFIAVLFELLNYIASTSFNDFKLIFMSYSIVLSLICIYRWGLIGSIVAGVGGVAFCAILHTSDISYYLVYGGGNFIGVLVSALLFQCLMKRETLMKHKILLIVYLTFDFLLVIVCRCLIASLFNYNKFLITFSQSFMYEIVMESMSYVISIIILLIASRKNSTFMVEMISYIKETKDRNKLGGLKEYKESSNFNMTNPFTEKDEIDEGNLIDGGQLSEKELKELDEMYKSSLKNEEGGNDGN